MCRFDRAAMKFRVDRYAFVAELDQRSHTVANTIGLKAGEIVGDDFGKHRNDAIGQVDAGRPSVSFIIEIRFKRHKVRHIGDVDAKFPVSILKPFE